MHATRKFLRWWHGDRVAQRVDANQLGDLAGEIPFGRTESAANVAVTGATGSGKTTTAYFDQIAMHAQAGDGAVILVPKVTDGDAVMRVLEMAGAIDRAIRVGPGSKACLNPLEWLCNRASKGGAVDFQIVRLLMQLTEVLDRGKSKGRDEDSYFRSYTERMLFFASACCRMAYGTVTFSDLLKFVTSLPATPEDIGKPQYLTGFAHTTVLGAVERAVSDYDRKVLNDVIDWVTGEFASLAEKPKSCVTTTATALLHRVVYGIPAELIGRRSTVNLETILHGAIFVIDVSPKEYFDEAILVQTVIKQFVQIVVEAHGGRSGRQVLLAIDEYPLFCVEADAGVMATSRASGLCWVIAFQTMPGLYAAFGGSEYAKHLVDAMMGNVNTIIATQSSCNVTNEWFCERIGKQTRYFATTSNSNAAYLRHSPWHPGPPQTQVSLSEQYDFLVHPFRMTQLRRGGPPHFIVDAVITRAGQPIGPNGEPYAFVTFKQWRL
ncbi:MAG: type IV secretory system conjugative DNA transfer family protein [Gemmataceae bacterium]